MHPDARQTSRTLYGCRAAVDNASREAPPPHAARVAIVREAPRVEHLACTRTQAAEALGISRSTFDRRVLPYIETIEMPWGSRLIPADELERLVAKRRRPPRRHVHDARRPDARQPSRRMSSIACRPSAAPARASPRSHTS